MYDNEYLNKLEYNVSAIGLIKCCQTERDNCLTCKKQYGNLDICPKDFASKLIKTIKQLDADLIIANRILENIEIRPNM